MKKVAFIFLSFLLIVPLGARASGRFFLEGDGSLGIQSAKTGTGGTVTYRIDDRYSSLGQQRLARIFGVPTRSSGNVSLRVVSLCDYLQDELKGGSIKIVSGYRSPEYSDGLRKKGKLAAKSSMHIDGMAADIDM